MVLWEYTICSFNESWKACHGRFQRNQWKLQEVPGCGSHLKLGVVLKYIDLLYVMLINNM